MGRTVSHPRSDSSRQFPTGIIPSGNAVLGLQLQSLLKLAKVRVNVFTDNLLSSLVAQTGLNYNGPLLDWSAGGHFRTIFDFLGKIIGAAVDIVTYNGSVGSLQGRGRDGHGRGLLLLLSGTALHLGTEVLMEYEALEIFLVEGRRNEKIEILKRRRSCVTFEQAFKGLGFVLRTW